MAKGDDLQNRWEIFVSSTLTLCSRLTLHRVARFFQFSHNLSIESMKKLREDIELKEYAESLGWMVITSKLDVENNNTPPHLPYSFRRNDSWLWLTSKGWCIAELPDAKIYVNHRYFKYLKDALV